MPQLPHTLVMTVTVTVLRLGRDHASSLPPHQGRWNRQLGQHSLNSSGDVHLDIANNLNTGLKEESVLSLTPYFQGRARPFSIKAPDIWSGNRAINDLVVTVDLGMLSSWEFGDLKSYSHWVSTKRRLTSPLAQGLLGLAERGKVGAGDLKAPSDHPGDVPPRIKLIALTPDYRENNGLKLDPLFSRRLKTWGPASSSSGSTFSSRHVQRPEYS